MRSLPENFTWSALVPELFVADLQTSLDFWCGLLGFSVAYDRPEIGFSYLQLGRSQIMLAQIDESDTSWHTGKLERPLGRGVNFQIEVDSLEPAVGRLIAAGWPLFQAVEEKWYEAGDLERGQRQFLVQDPDGYLVRLIEQIGLRSTSIDRSAA